MADKKEADRIASWDAEVLNALMQTPQGRFFVERFMDYCGEGQELYLNDGDALGMAKRDGLARAGRWWRIMLEQHCPDRYLQMVRERRSRIARAQAKIKENEAAAPSETPEMGGQPMMEAMADEQARLAAEEAAKAAKDKKG